VLKRLCLITAALLFLVPSWAWAAESVGIRWNANTESDLAGYKVYCGVASRDYSFSQDNGNQTQAVIMLADGTWFCAVTAYDNAPTPNESGFSNEVSTTITTEPPPVVVTPPGTPIPTTTAQGVRWDWPPCEGCSGYLYRYEGGDGETVEPSILIPDFPGDWFCVTAKELGWGDSALTRCNRYEPPVDVTPPEPPTGIIIEIPAGTTGIRIEFLKE